MCPDTKAGHPHHGTRILLRGQGLRLHSEEAAWFSGHNWLAASLLISMLNMLDMLIVFDG